MPFYTEAMDAKLAEYKPEEEMPKGPNFTMEHLQHLNKQPNFNYLKIA